MPFSRLALTPTRILADQVVHLFRPEVPGQVRGVSWFAPVMLRLGDLDSWRDAQLVRQKVAAMLTAFVTTTDGTAAPFDGATDPRGNSRRRPRARHDQISRSATGHQVLDAGGHRRGSDRLREDHRA
jgi:capsid protein